MWGIIFFVGHFIKLEMPLLIVYTYTKLLITIANEEKREYILMLILPVVVVVATVVVLW